MPRTRTVVGKSAATPRVDDKPDDVIGELFFTEESYTQLQRAPEQPPAPIMGIPVSSAVITTSVAKPEGPRVELIRIPPFAYLHVTDTNANVTRVVEGPQTFFLMDQEVVVLGPIEMVRLPPRHFCIVSNPVVRGSSGVVLDKNGQAKLRHGDQEVRLDRDYPDPFPLYPGEELTPRTILPLQVVPANTALRLRATRDFVDRSTGQTETRRRAGEEWLFEGHATYFPQVEVEICATIQAVVVKPNQALRLRARNACVDRHGRERRAGEEWLIGDEGSYLPGVEEIIVSIINATVLTDKLALHLQATRNFTDAYEVSRSAGDEWLVTRELNETHIPGVYEKVIGLENIITLTNRQFCIVLNPVDHDTGKPQLGLRRLLRGPLNFFLQPGESLDYAGIQEVYILGQEEALWLKCREQFDEDVGRAHVTRRPGDRWLWYGPGEFVPRLEVDVVQRRKALLRMEGLGINWFFWMTTRTYVVN